MIRTLILSVLSTNTMSRSKSSSQWLNEHFNDQYVKDSQKDGYRSRASYKLIELDKKDKLFKPNTVVVDLGSAPGGWSQVAVEKIGHKGKVIASDILNMDSLAGVTFIEGDFTEQSVLNRILDVLGEAKADLVISDMAPNLSGIADIDQPKSMYLVELALDMAMTTLKPNGNFVCKVFQGEGFDELSAQCKQAFKTVVIRKPSASRARSKEVYIVAKGFKA